MMQVEDVITCRVVEGMREDVNLQESKGLAGLYAVNSRCVAKRLSINATDDIQILSCKGCLRCCNCGLAIDETMKLPVRDPHDPIAQTQARDYVRIPLDFDELRTRTSVNATDNAASFEYSDYVACTPPCALRFMYESPDFVSSHVPDLFAKMMWLRHRINEPVNAAPTADCLSYLYRWRLTNVNNANHTNHTNHTNGSTKEIGLGSAAFYWLLGTLNVIGYKQMAPMYIPPMPEEHLALANRDHRFTQYYYQEATAAQHGPPQVGARLPSHLPTTGIKLDATPDADAETDFASDSIHPPHALPPHAPPPPPPPPPGVSTTTAPAMTSKSQSISKKSAATSMK
jgi:hypothetical protein